MKKVVYGFFLFAMNIVFAQGTDTENYIRKYHKIAIDEMHSYGIPASITLAQGILESGNGNSRLSRKSKNHFGIKCHKHWKGKKVFHDDDAKDECFRKYKKVADSYKHLKRIRLILQELFPSLDRSHLHQAEAISWGIGPNGFPL